MAQNLARKSSTKSSYRLKYKHPCLTMAAGSAVTRPKSTSPNALRTCSQWVVRW